MLKHSPFSSIYPHQNSTVATNDKYTYAKVGGESRKYAWITINTWYQVSGVPVSLFYLQDFLYNAHHCGTLARARGALQEAYFWGLGISQDHLRCCTDCQSLRFIVMFLKQKYSNIPIYAYLHSPKIHLFTSMLYIH